MLIKFAMQIKSSLTMSDICEKYGIEINRQGFAVCPFHNENTASMKVYNGDRGYCCYGCGKTGDVIAFVSELFSLPFAQTLQKINADFHLGLPFERKMTLREKYSFKEAEKKRETEKQKREALLREYNRAYDLYAELDRIRLKHKPRSPDEEPHPDFIRAIRELAAAENRLNKAEGELFSYEMRKMRRQNDRQGNSL